MSVSATEARLPASTKVEVLSRSDDMWMVGAMFVFSMCAVFVLTTATGFARVAVGFAALIAPLVSHRVLARRR